jgi:hypothetical protein
MLQRCFARAATVNDQPFSFWPLTGIDDWHVVKSGELTSENQIKKKRP